MRVAVLGSFPLDTTRIPGGVEAVIHNLAVSQARLPGIDLHILTCVEGLAEQATKPYRGMTVHYLPGQKRWGNLTHHFQEQRHLRGCLADLRPDIVHAHGTGHYVAAAQAAGLPTVITVHGLRFKEVTLFGGLKGWARRITTVALERQVLRRADHIFVIAEYVRQAILPMTRARLYPAANPVAEGFFALPTVDPGATILSVAAVQPRKGLLDLVEAVAIVRRTQPDVKLRLVGKVLMPEYAEKIRRRIQELDLGDAVQMLGFLPEAELEKEFTGCSVFALCSREESSPVSIAEAMTLGKPVVATAVGGVPDLVAQDVTGCLVGYGDVPALAGTLIRMLSDGELRAAMGTAARARAARDFHPDAAAANAVAVYERVLSPKGNPT